MTIVKLDGPIRPCCKGCDWDRITDWGLPHKCANPKCPDSEISFRAMRRFYPEKMTQETCECREERLKE